MLGIDFKLSIAYLKCFWVLKAILTSFIHNNYNL